MPIATPTYVGNIDNGRGRLRLVLAAAGLPLPRFCGSGAATGSATGGASSLAVAPYSL